MPLDRCFDVAQTRRQMQDFAVQLASFSFKVPPLLMWSARFKLALIGVESKAKLGFVQSKMRPIAPQHWLAGVGGAPPSALDLKHRS